jgi:hypothetical protein
MTSTIKRIGAVLASVVTALALQNSPAAQRGQGGAPGGERGPDVIEIVKGTVVIRRVSVSATKEAATTQINRFGQTFSATPFESVLKLAAIPPGTRVRVIGEEEEMVLQAGTREENPADYAVIFNLRGFPVLTPWPPGAARGATSAPRRGAGSPQNDGLPPAGSRGGNPQNDGARGGNGDLPPAGSRGGLGPPTIDPAAASLPPPGSGRGGGTGGGGGSGSGPGRPAGFAPLKEVRSFTRIEILN